MEKTVVLAQPWDNAACLGYVIAALENLDYKYDQIWQVAAEMKELFDWTTIDEAKEHYCESTY
jgi:hypothetical protein